jgi:toxin ParE1/3/4
LFHWRNHAVTPADIVQKPRHIIFYRLADDEVIEVVRLLHDAMEVKLHLPED